MVISLGNVFCEKKRNPAGRLSRAAAPYGQSIFTIRYNGLDIKPSALGKQNRLDGIMGAVMIGFGLLAGVKIMVSIFMVILEYSRKYFHGLKFF